MYSIIGNIFTATIRFNESGESSKQAKVKILDKIKHDNYTRYVVEDVELNSETLGKIAVISPDDLITTT